MFSKLKSGIQNSLNKVSRGLPFIFLKMQGITREIKVFLCGLENRVNMLLKMTAFDMTLHSESQDNKKKNPINYITIMVGFRKVK